MDVPSDIMSRYFERRKRDVEVCFHSLEEENFPVLEKVGHQLKGNGVTFGYPEISELGDKLEKAAAEHDPEEIKEVLQDLSTWVDQHLN